jgi:nucleoside 2-deoxyribosyltransferase
MKNDSYTVYFAGALFSGQQLIGNSLIAASVESSSGGRFICRVPQNFESQDCGPQAIRDADITALLSCDAALFHYDGCVMDSGTVVEFMVAKFADIPSVIVRTDFPNGGDSAGGPPWNLMSAYFPRTEILLIHSMSHYQQSLKR